MASEALAIIEYSKFELRKHTVRLKFSLLKRPLLNKSRKRKIRSQQKIIDRKRKLLGEYKRGGHSISTLSKKYKISYREARGLTLLGSINCSLNDSMSSYVDDVSAVKEIVEADRNVFISARDVRRKLLPVRK